MEYTVGSAKETQPCYITQPQFRSVLDMICKW